MLFRDPNPDGFLKMAKAPNENVELSFKAKGILSYIMGHSDNWVPRTSDIVAHGKEGRRAVLAALKELRAAGYMYLAIRTDKEAQLAGKEWAASDKPMDSLMFSRKCGFSTVAKCNCRKTALRTYVQGERTDKKQRKNNRGANAPADGEATTSIGFGVEQEDKLFSLCQKFADYSLQRYGTKYTPHIIQKRWRVTVQEFVQHQLKQDVRLFRSTLLWYLKHVENDKYLPECQSMINFCQKFRSIEKARHRREGTDVDLSHVTTTAISCTKIIKGEGLPEVVW